MRMRNGRKRRRLRKALLLPFREQRAVRYAQSPTIQALDARLGGEFLPRFESVVRRRALGAFLLLATATVGFLLLLWTLQRLATLSGKGDDSIIGLIVFLVVLEACYITLALIVR